VCDGGEARDVGAREAIGSVAWIVKRVRFSL
jgi:hypothetical protein